MAIKVETNARNGQVWDTVHLPPDAFRMFGATASARLELKGRDRTKK
jgi:hypothetical protein